MSKRKNVVSLSAIMADWTVGRRVTRTDGSDKGTIVEATASFKVKWDSGRTSHYTGNKPADVKLEKKESDSLE